MAGTVDGVDPIWDDLDRAMGQLFMMGWEGTEVTPQIRELIEKHHLGSILLTNKNLKSAHDTARLVQELQTIAHQAGHPVPLTIALDQENGSVNSLYDENYISQFPSAMGMAATASPELAFDVAKATAQEMDAVGVNMMMGPVLDVLTNARYQPIGVRTSGDDPQEVSQYGIAAMNGFRDAGLSTCGKHFPSYGNLDFLGSTLDMPTITETLEQLSLSALVPFRNAIAAGLDAMMVGGCAIANSGMNVMHACLSDQVVDDLLRKDLGFDGVVISECLEMESLTKDIGVRGGTVMAVEAGCDLVLLCRSFSVQQEAISGLRLGVENDMISADRIRTSLKRVLKVKARSTSWQQALNPAGISLLSTLHPSHSALSTKAYNQSITVMRDKDHLLPLSNLMDPSEELLLLTPLVKPLPASAASKTLADGIKSESQGHDSWRQRTSIMSGEGVFRELGRSLARQRRGKLLHTSYTANGVRPVHENLINRASTIIVVTADANRNLYQTGFTKHVAMMCSLMRASGTKKSLIVVSVSSPYDFAMDKSIGTYVCTFDFTETAMAALVRILFGECLPQGTLPGTLRKSRKVQKSRQNWLVEAWNSARDARGLDALIKAIQKSAGLNQSTEMACATSMSFELHNPKIEEMHFVVRNSSTQALYGFCAAYIHNDVGMIGAIFVDPTKRNLSIGHSLHQRALRGLLLRTDLKKTQLGTGLPSIYPGIPVTDSTEGQNLMRWFGSRGWRAEQSRPVCNMIIQGLNAWRPPDALLKEVQRVAYKFDLVHGGADNADTIMEHILKFSSPDIMELYKLALQDTSACGVVRAKDPRDGSLVGVVIICKSETALRAFLPSLHQFGNSAVGIVAPVISTAVPDAHRMLQGLVLLGIRQNKNNRSRECIVNYVDGISNRESLSAMGFQSLHSFEQLSNSPREMGRV